METLLFISSWARIYRRNVRKDVRLLHDSREVQGKLCSAVLKALEIFLFAVPARENLSVWEFHRMPCAAAVSWRMPKEHRGNMMFRRSDSTNFLCKMDTHSAEWKVTGIVPFGHRQIVEVCMADEMRWT